MIYCFAIGAVIGIIVLVIEALRHQWALWSKEGVTAMIIYPVVCGWALCFTWKIIQWPFL